MLEHITSLVAATWQLFAELHLPISWVAAGAILLGFVVGGVQLAGWAAAYYAAIFGAGLLAPAFVTFAQHNPAAQPVLADWPWVSLALPGLAIATCVLFVATLARKAFRLVGLGLVDRLAGAGIGFLAATGGLATVSWLAAQVAVISTAVRA